MEVSLCVPNVAALFLILTVQQSSVVQVSSVPEGLEKFVIQRRKYGTDLFTLHFKNGFQCAKNPSDVGKWCESLNAHYHPESNNRGICSCTCKNQFRTFLPEKQICVNSTGAANFGGKYKKRTLYSLGTTYCTTSFCGKLVVHHFVCLDNPGRTSNLYSTPDHVSYMANRIYRLEVLLHVFHIVFWIHDNETHYKKKTKKKQINN